MKRYGALFIFVVLINNLFAIDLIGKQYQTEFESIKFFENYFEFTDKNQKIQYSCKYEYKNTILYLQLANTKFLRNSEFIILYSANFIYMYTSDNKLVFEGVREISARMIEMIFSQPKNFKNASSFLIENEINYSVENLADINLGKPWVEGVTGYGIGQTITLNFDEDKYLTGLIISNGFVTYDKPQLYENNSRIKSIKITQLNSKKSIVVNLLDTPNPQFIPIPFLFEENSNSKVGDLILEILNIYKGLKYQDTCINWIVPYRGYMF